MLKIYAEFLVSDFKFLMQFTGNGKLETGNSSRLCGRFLWNFPRQLFENGAETAQNLLCRAGIQRKLQHSIGAELSAPL